MGATRHLTLDPDAVRATSAAHDRFVASGQLPERVRTIVADSWRRSAAAGVDPDVSNPPVVFDRGELDDYRETHPLAHVFPLLYDVLGRAAEDCDGLMAVGDACGRLLWVAGRSSVVSKAELINFVEGSTWDEEHAGTNAPGTALRMDAPVQIHASEHFTRPVQQWSCTAAPIHDPVTHGVLGIVDVTGGDEIATPQTMAMVRAAARMAEAELGRIVAVSGPERLWTPVRSWSVEMTALGRADCQVDVDGRVIRLSPRHSEIIVLLMDHPDGLTGDRLAAELYADDVRSSTIRAELTRLRALLGPRVLDSRPYRLRGSPRCDWRSVSSLLDAGRVADALRAYAGPLLPHSDAPGVVARRERLERRLRTAVLTSGDALLAAEWTATPWGADDVELWQHQAESAATGSATRELALRELRRIDAELA